MDSFCRDKEGLGPLSPVYSDLTICFINGVLINASSLFLIIFGTGQFFSLYKKKNIRLKVDDWSFKLKLFMVVLQVAFTVGLLASNQQKDLINPILSLFALLIGLNLHYIERFKTNIPNGILLFYWLFTAMFGVLKIGNLTVRSKFNSEFIFSVFITINGFFILLVESLVPAKYSREIELNPLETSNVFGRISFSWMSPLMVKGDKKFLVQNDLPPLPRFLEASNAFETLKTNWNKQLSYTTKPSLVNAIAKSFGGPFVIAGLFKAIQDILAFTQPQLLRYLIKFVNDYNESPEDDRLPLTRGYMIVFAMFLVSIVQSACLHQYFQRAFDLGMKIKSSLISTIYAKSLKLSNENKLSNSTGDIVNLMSVDTQRLQDLVQYLQVLWSGPFQVILCLTSLHSLLGNAMWIGVAIMIIMVPLNGVIAKQQKKLQKIQMKNKDERTGIVSEILNNIKSLKLYGWEIPYMEKLTYVRNEKELKNLKKMGIFQAFSNFTWNTAPFLVSCSTFGVFVLINKDTPLSTDLVFPALSLFNLLSFPLAVFPNVITSVIEAQVAVSRLSKFFASEELQNDSVVRLPAVNKIGEEAVKVTNGEFLWTRLPYKPALSNINFVAKKGELNCIIGKVGTGKSSFIQAILGDLYKSEGLVITHGSIAYVPQVPWIMNGTIKDNILFGSRYDPDFYAKTIAACALEKDLEILPKGDKTQVGEKGISLSGGQKSRLSLARAVYSRAAIYLFDDPLSAVDEHVGKHLINNVFGPNGLLSTKCRILTTNNLNVLKYSNYIAMLQNGTIVEEGSFAKIMENENSLLNTLITEFSKHQKTPTSSVPPSALPSSVELNKVSVDDDFKIDAKSLRKASVSTFKLPEEEDDEEERKIRAEAHQQGKVKWAVYLAYAKSCNPKGVVVFLTFIMLSMATGVLGNIWLKHWSEVNSELGYNPNVAKYLLIYFILGVGSSALSLCQIVILWVFCTIHGSRNLHKRMANRVLRAPMSFFETTPIGRILNRFSNDIYKVDEVLGRVFSMFFSNTIKVFFTILVICWSTWQFIFFVIPMGFAYYYYQQYYLRTSRELRRLDSISRSPVFSHFQETLNGVSTIRAYDQTERFEFLNEARVDKNMCAYHPAISANRWLAVRLEFLGSLVILCASGLSVATLDANHVTAGIVGLSVSYALQITQSLNWIVRMTVEVETNIVSVERIEEYCNLDIEAPDIIESNRPPAHWPFNGEIKFQDYCARYRPDLDYCLNHINLLIKPKEKIGIVGRTGAGKSSLTMALFRIIEASEGYIAIDSLQTNTIGLADLRHKLSIIPQDSQVFEGTVKENLDPTNQYTDEQLWKSLELSRLSKHIKQMSIESGEENGLNVKLAEGGSNLSVGQRQLICLARALLIESAILVLDEATAAVDVETDKILQETIRSEFKNRTILTIAHRLNTIMDSDRIMVLERGKVAEFDTPENLLKKKDSLFYSLCLEGGLIEE